MCYIYRIHAFDIARKGNCENINNKENIKISIRKNNNEKDVMKVLKEEASKYGFELSDFKEKDTTQKA